MKIEKIEIKNFGILSDVVLDMSGDQGNLVFVNGLNGRGKTTFQSAIRWCFYGDEPKSTTKFASRFGMKNLEVNESLTVKASATITLDGDGTMAFLERAQIFIKQSNGIPKKLGAPTLTVKTKAPGASALTDIQVNEEAWINQYFPKNLINFFLFDGEMMVNFFSANVKEEIEKAIREIAGVDLFDEISKKLEAVESQINRRVSKLTGPKSQQLADELEVERRLLSEIYAEYTGAKSNLETKRKRVTEINSLLEESQNIQSTAKRLEEIELSLTSSEEVLKTSERDFYSMLLASGTTSLLAGSFEELQNQVVLAKQEDRLPPAFDPARIHLLIEDGRCICGCEIEPGDNRSKELLKLIEKFAISSDVGKLLDGASRESEKIIFAMKSDWKSIQMSNELISKMNNEIMRLRAERDNLTIKLQGSDVATIRALAVEKQDHDRSIQKLVDEVASLEVQSKNAADKVNRLDAELAASAKGNAEAETLRKEGVLARQISEAASRIHEIAIKQVREELQEAIQEKFNVVKAGKFRTEITENFEVLTLNEDGSKVDLSEGESMAKAYVFSLALRDVINLGFPLIVDTPFGRLSGDFRAWLSEVLSTFLVQEVKKTNRQIIFLMTDTEYTPYTKTRFAKAKGLEFFLAYEKDNETDKSILGKGIDPEWLKHDYWKDWEKIK
jgi:DNA sulfur modification protein DndD